MVGDRHKPHAPVKFRGVVCFFVAQVEYPISDAMPLLKERLDGSECTRQSSQSFRLFVSKEVNVFLCRMYRSQDYSQNTPEVVPDYCRKSSNEILAGKGHSNYSLGNIAEVQIISIINVAGSVSRHEMLCHRLNGIKLKAALPTSPLS
jgi:hypothetical protein